VSARYRLTAAAAADLFEIYQYTAENWGEGQADRYQIELHRHLSNAADNPLLGTAQNELGKSVRKYLAESHVIYYRPTGQNIEVLRVLHVRQDGKRAFRR
jgi:toxin ParE1/3/4